MTERKPLDKKKYTPGQAVLDAQQQAQAHKDKKPGDYQSQWKDQADGLLQQIQNREPFFYDAARDPMYRQAVDQYVRLGKQAMMDTLGQAAALTGGYGNSYGQTVGQQTYQGYLQALGMKLPQFHKMALDQYQARGKDLMDRYQALSQREKDSYGRYQQILQQYYARQDQLDDAYDRLQQQDYHRYQDDRDFTYNQQMDQQAAQAQADRDAKEQARWEQEQAYQKERDKIKDQQWKDEFEENRRRYEQQWAAKHSGGSSSGGGGGGRGYGGGDLNRYQKQQTVSNRQVDSARKHAQQMQHYGRRPAGKPWSPSQHIGYRPFRPVIIG